MDEYQHTVLTRGGYRVVAITRDEVYAPDAIVAYAVVTNAGTRITPDLSLDQAKVWIDSLLESESGGRTSDFVDHKPVVRR
ncbi:hypothetical protein FQK02_08970 [Xanthomonas vasicola]|uniref:Uncharacterized protein n=1 Tax=Xanthomonas vasicola pv. vasculorum NCPPB 890 TaxID=1184265 RepID=A0A836P4S2_XANVA|nr:hypothetical protein [Xanthomonas vasicola]KFA25814.1 hypothetical protein KW5_0115600 [Xanthomonas vasicola pv. vasculorum NCPPB 1326]KFA33388.1 hypothetical protein KWG_0105220 [Xanthomonas vasicola pv. vasculorum NCPPB 1381]MBV6744968.1 hypothetical protein [Xanthomonas vasicola pv. vasculorum NCPPB 890]MBV6892645.1 hypothetical protein [Xanthomonas vasicola pv. vasculorum]MDO6948699.1 hypothetical protein [Xanthomonas vasicola]